jgi:hypothetical protein
MAKKSWFLEGLLAGAVIGYCISALVSDDDIKTKKSVSSKQKETRSKVHSKKRILQILNRVLDGIEMGIDRVIDALENQKEEKKES